MRIRRNWQGTSSIHRCSNGHDRGTPATTNIHKEYHTVQKPFTYALLLAATLALAACEKTPEDKMESAKESAADAIESMGEAMEDKTNQVLGNEPTTGDKIEDAAEDAADAIEEAGKDAKDAVDGQ
jgi:hypothetical protein